MWKPSATSSCKFGHKLSHHVMPNVLALKAPGRHVMRSVLTFLGRILAGKDHIIVMDASCRQKVNLVHLRGPDWRKYGVVSSVFCCFSLEEPTTFFWGNRFSATPWSQLSLRPHWPATDCFRAFGAKAGKNGRKMAYGITEGIGQKNGRKMAKMAPKSHCWAIFVRFFPFSAVFPPVPWWGEDPFFGPFFPDLGPKARRQSLAG